MTYLVALTSCATGIAHSYMAAQAIENIAHENNYRVKVEIQGAMGTENELSPIDIESADVIILANDVAIKKAERFSPHQEKIIKLSPHSIIQNSNTLAQAIAEKISRNGANHDG